MLKVGLLFLVTAGFCAGEVHTMTLRQAVDLAMKQSPDVVLARLEQNKARESVRIAKDPFTPKLSGGSGLAKTWGFPTSIDGNAPSIFEARTTMYLYDRSQSYLVAQARENQRGAEIQSRSREDDVAFRTASLFLDAEQAGHNADAAQRQLESLQKVEASVRLRVQEGRELESENTRAQLNVAKARQRLENLKMDQENAETSLALVLGFGPDDRIHPAEEERAKLQLPEDEDAAVETALKNSKEVRTLESQMQAKELEIRSYRAARYPKIGLVAQYSLLAKYNNFEQFFRNFQRNNAELGVSIQVPLLVGSGVQAAAALADADISRLRTNVNLTRNRITVDTRRGYQEVRKAETAREVARLDLTLAREQLSALLAQMEEGRAPMTKVEEARVQENEKWIAFYDADNAVERTRLNVLRQTGALLAALK